MVLAVRRAGLDLNERGAAVGAVGEDGEAIIVGDSAPSAAAVMVLKGRLLVGLSTRIKARNRGEVTVLGEAGEGVVRK